MTELEFKALAAQGYNRIPLIAESFADLETPLSLYLKLARSERSGANSFLLESVVGGERFGRYSFIGLPARTSLSATLGSNGAHHTVVRRDGAVTEEDHGDPLRFIERWFAQFKVALRPGLPRFCGGLAGYFGYDTVRLIEKKLAQPRRDDLGLPDIHLLLTEELAVIDNLSGRAYLIVYGDGTRPRATREHASGCASCARGWRAISSRRIRAPACADPSGATLPRPTSWPRWIAPSSTSPPAM
jgi:anthranilate synthase component I